MVTNCIAFVVLMQTFISVNTKLCIGVTGKSCCDGYKWDLTRTKSCEKGFYRRNCETKCIYPTYGQGCQSVCNCNVTLCDHAQGCMQSSGEYIHSTIHLSLKTATSKQMNEVRINETNSSSIDGIAQFVTASCNIGTEPFKMSVIEYSIIGLASMSVLLLIFYVCTHLLEKYQVRHGTF